MGRLQRIENKLERAINGAFAKAFRAEVQPVEIASAVRRAMDDGATSLSKGRTFVPTRYLVELSETDFERLTAYEDDLRDELLAAVAEHAESQRYQTKTDFGLSFRRDDELETGLFRIVTEDAPDKTHRDGQAEARKREAREHGRSSTAQSSGIQSSGTPSRSTRSPSTQSPQNQGSGGRESDQSKAGSGQPSGTPAARGKDPGSRDRSAAASPSQPGTAHRGPEGSRDPDAESYDARTTRQRDSREDPLEGPTRREPATPHTSPRAIAPADRPWLEIDGDRYPLLGPTTTLGRDTAAQVVLDDANISRRHCEVRVTNDGPHLVARVRDLGSTNGTWVNGERTSSMRLSPGDRITIGQTTLIYHAGRR